MNNDFMYSLAIIAVITLVTWGLRAVPFIVFKSKQLPESVKYLSDALPPAIMTILVIYCLRNTSLSSYPYGLPEIISCGAVVLLQVIKKNMYLSIIAGTVLYMVLIRIM